MNTATLLSLLGALGVLIGFIFWVRSFFTQSFEPEQGEYYVLRFFGFHLFTICINEPTYKWFQKLKFYLLFFPFNIARFMYEWVEAMTYNEYLQKKAEGCEVRVEWQPEYKDEDVDRDGQPKNKTVKVLVDRKEMKKSLKKIEAYSFAAEFETKDGYHGNRIFTLFLQINDMSTVISRIYNWQTAASLSFNNAFNAWSKTVTYEELRKTTIEQLKLVLGRDHGSSFLDEVSDEVKEFGYTIARAQAGNIYLDLASLDIREAQENAAKAGYELEATKKKADGIKATADANAYATEQVGTAEAKVTGVKGKAEATVITNTGTAEVEILKQKTKVLEQFISDTNKATVDQIKAKYGDQGIANLRGVFVENGTGHNNYTVRELTNHLVANEIEKVKGGNDEEAE